VYPPATTTSTAWVHALPPVSKNNYGSATTPFLLSPGVGGELDIYL